MWLNAKDENGRIKPITGEVHYPTGTQQLDGEYWYDFFPDGWVLPESGWPRGFQAPEEHFQELGNPDEYLPGTVTGPNREPIGE